MHLHLRSVAAAALFASTLLCQVTIPPHASTYNGFSRGFQFTANVSFVITQLTLPTDAFQTGDTGSFLVRVNGNVVLRSIKNNGTIFPNITITSGQSVDIIGNWSPAATGTFTAHNSYGSGAPFNTMIEGVAHSLNRTGWQWDIGDAAWLSGSYLAPGGGSLGRVFMHTAPANAAVHGSYGTGCANLTLAASARPVLGTTVDLNTTNAPAASSSGLMILGVQQLDPGVALDAIGMTGCFQHASLDLMLAFPVSNMAGRLTVPIPNVPSYVGAYVFAQSAVIAPGVNPLGLITSNGVSLRLGSQ